jgi:hypothetical protein
VVLLHDGGGDRSRTVETLRQLIPQLKAQGHKLVTVSQLLGRSRDAVMPLVSGQDQLLAGVDRLVFDTIFTLETFLGIAFTVAIFLGMGRVSFLIPLALLNRRRAKRRTYDPSYQPRVSVLIAAFNERPVISRTIRSVLCNSYPALEVIVVDDGSTDGTAEEVAQVYGQDGRVRLIQQANAGKAAALNRAMSEASGEVQVCFDSGLLAHLGHPRRLPGGLAAVRPGFHGPACGGLLLQPLLLRGPARVARGISARRRTTLGPAGPLLATIPLSAGHVLRALEIPAHGPPRTSSRLGQG